MNVGENARHYCFAAEITRSRKRRRMHLSEAHLPSGRPTIRDAQERLFSCYTQGTNRLNVRFGRTIPSRVAPIGYQPNACNLRQSSHWFGFTRISKSRVFTG